MARKYLSTFTCLTAIALLPFAVQAANEERLPGVIDKDQPKVEVPKSHSLDKKKSGALEKAPQQEAGDDAVITTLKDVRFEGDAVIDESDLREVAAPYIGKKITGADLKQLKFELTSLYYDKGYILVKIVTRQNISGGVLKVQIYEAKVGELEVHNDGALNPVVADALAARMGAGDTFREIPVESMISDIDQLEGIAATLNLQPGKAVGTTDLHLAIDEAGEEEHYVSVDNYGSELTGRSVGTLHLEKKNMLNLGEVVEGDFRRSSGDLWSANIGAITPIGLRNIKLELNAARSYNEIGDRLAALDATGETDSASVAFSSDIIITRTHKVTTRLGLEARQHESELADVPETEDDIRQAFATASYLYRAFDSVFYVSSKVSRGLSILGASELGDPLATRATGEPESWIFEPTIVAQTRAIDPDGALKAVVSGQVASNTLLSSDLVSLGGYGSVRGFEPAQETGEAGYQFTVEYLHDVMIPDAADWTLRAGPFVDGGAVYNRLPGQSVDSHLYSAGVGLEVSTQFVPDINPTTLRLDWAHPLGDYNSTEVDDDMIYFRVSQTF